MHDKADSNNDAIAREFKPRPPGLRELSPRAIICGLCVAVVMGASYPYVVLKLGFGPNVSVVAAILGYVALGLIFTGVLRLLGIGHTPYNRWENNIVQTAGTAAAQTAFMCILLAAFDMLAENKNANFNLRLTPVQSFAWLTAAGLLGVLMTVPLRRHFIVDEKLPFADGMAAGETILVCDSEGPVAKRAAMVMIVGMAASAILMTLKEDTHVWKNGLPGVFLFGTALMTRMRTGMGAELGLLSFGSGMIIGPRITINMLIGTLFSWALLPHLLVEQFGILPDTAKRVDIIYWVMWPAVGLLVAGGLTTLLLRWQVLMKTFKNLSASSGVEEFPLSWVIIGSIVCAIALIGVQYYMFEQPIWMTVVAIIVSLPLALVGVRVLGETNWGPISALANMMQGIFAFVAPGNMAANMVASGTTGTIVSESEAIMQDYKAGDMVGSSPRNLTYMQLLATPVGAAAVAWMYPILHQTYGFGENGLSSPTSRRWEGLAVILSQGFDALPKGALPALIGGAVLGIVLAVVESLVKNKTFVPSATGLGIGMLIPGAAVVTMVLGAITGSIWTRVDRRSSELYQIPLASGFIAGEAIVAVVVPLLIVTHVLEA